MSQVKDGIQMAQAGVMALAGGYGSMEGMALVGGRGLWPGG